MDIHRNFGCLSVLESEMHTVTQSNKEPSQWSVSILERLPISLAPVCRAEGVFFFWFHDKQTMDMIPNEFTRLL